MLTEIQDEVRSALERGAATTGQLPLHGAGAPVPDVTFATVRRTMLDAHSWVDFAPDWLSGQEALFDELARGAGWEHRERKIFNQVFQEPRFTAEYPGLVGVPMDGALHDIAAALSDRYGTSYDGLWMNFYRDHRDGAGWHADRPANRPQEAIVPVLSLGAQRRFLIKPVEGGRSIVFSPRGGDLLVMGGRAQRDWRHAAPKQTTPAGPRISLNFSSSTQIAAP